MPRAGFVPLAGAAQQWCLVCRAAHPYHGPTRPARAVAPPEPEPDGAVRLCLRGGCDEPVPEAYQLLARQNRACYCGPECRRIAKNARRRVP